MKTDKVGDEVSDKVRDRVGEKNMLICWFLKTDGFSPMLWEWQTRSDTCSGSQPGVNLTGALLA